MATVSLLLRETYLLLLGIHFVTAILLVNKNKMKFKKPIIFIVAVFKKLKNVVIISNYQYLLVTRSTK